MSYKLTSTLINDENYKKIFREFGYCFQEHTENLPKQICSMLVSAYEDHNPYAIDYTLHALMDVISDIYNSNTEWDNDKRSAPSKRMHLPSLDIDMLTLYLYILKSKPSSEVQKSIYALLSQVKTGWEDNKTYKFSNDCLLYGHSCRDPQGISHESWHTLSKDFDKLFIKKPWGPIISSLFAYSITSLFSSRLNFNHIRLPFPLHIACDRGSNIRSLIERVVCICDVNMPIHTNCQKNGKPKFARRKCSYVPPTVYTLTGQFAYDLKELKRIHDVPSIVLAFGEQEETDSLIRRIPNQHSLDTGSLKGGFNTLPIFISDIKALPKSHGESIFLDLHDMEVSEEIFELLRKHQALLGSWVKDLLLDAPRDLLNPEPSDDTSPIQHCQALSRHLINYRNQFRSQTLENNDFLSITTLIFFLRHFFSRMNHSLREYADTKLQFDGQEFINSFDAPLASAKVASHIALVTGNYLSYVQSSRYADQTTTIDVDNEGAEKSDTQQIQKKGKQYLKRLLSIYQDYGIQLLPKGRASYKNGRYIFPVTLGPGTRISSVTANTSEVRMHLNLPFFYPSVTGDSIELIVSENDISVCNLETLLESPSFIQSQQEIPYAVGVNTLGDPVIADVADFPHVLIGGTTGSGKSSALHCLLTSIVWRQPSDKVKLLLMDFGSSSLSVFENTPHILTPEHIISDPEEGYRYLMSLLMLMQDRENQLRSLSLQEQKELKAKWPSVVCAIDELPRLADAVPDATNIITQLLERSRKQKIHMVFCTQDATQDRLHFKSNNIPSRIAFKCNSHHTSESILGASGAEKLTGKGAMYLKTSNGDPTFTYGAYMEPMEIQKRLSQHEFHVAGTYQDLILPNPDTTEFQIADNIATDTRMSVSPKPWCGLSPADSLVQKVVLYIYSNNLGTISANQIKKQFRTGQDTAKNCIDNLEKLGIISPRQGHSKRPRCVDLEAAKQFLDEQHIPLKDYDVHQ